MNILIKKIIRYFTLLEINKMKKDQRSTSYLLNFNKKFEVKLERLLILIKSINKRLTNPKWLKKTPKNKNSNNSSRDTPSLPSTTECSPRDSMKSARSWKAKTPNSAFSPITALKPPTKN
jgi:hypothetical protein